MPSHSGVRLSSGRLVALCVEALELERALVINAVLQHRAQRLLTGAASACQYALSAAELSGELARRCAAMTTARSECDALRQQLHQIVSEMPRGRSVETDGAVVKALAHHETVLLALTALQSERPVFWIRKLVPGRHRAWAAKVEACAAACVQSASELAAARRSAAAQHAREAQEERVNSSLMNARSRLDATTAVALAMGINKDVAAQTYAQWAAQSGARYVEMEAEQRQALRRLNVLKQEGDNIRARWALAEAEIVALQRVFKPDGTDSAACP